MVDSPKLLRAEEASLKTFRRRAVSCIVGLALLIAPATQARPNVGLSIEVFSWGPVSLSVGTPLRGAGALIGGLALVGSAVAYLVRGRGTSSYHAEFSGATSSDRFSISIRPDDRVSANVMRIRYHDVILNNRVSLVGGGYLSLEDDGRLVFRDSAFAGYLSKQHDGTIAVCTNDHRLVLALVPRNETSILLLEKSDQSALVLRLLGVAMK